MKFKSMIPLLVATVLGVAAFMVGKDMVKPTSPTAQGPEMTPVVLFTRDLSPGAMLQQSDLFASQLPPNLVPHGTVAAPADAFGRVLTTRVVKGQTLLGAMLA